MKYLTIYWWWEKRRTWCLVKLFLPLIGSHARDKNNVNKKKVTLTLSPPFIDLTLQSWHVWSVTHLIKPTPTSKSCDTDWAHSQPGTTWVLSITHKSSWFFFFFFIFLKRCWNLWVSTIPGICFFMIQEEYKKGPPPSPGYLEPQNPSHLFFSFNTIPLFM